MSVNFGNQVQPAAPGFKSGDPAHLSSVFDDISVCIPTVQQRKTVLNATLAEWRRFGVTPLVQLQSPDWPMGGMAQRRNCDLMLLRALDERPDAGFILFSEDDIILGPDVRLWTAALKLLNAPATLYLHGLAHYPPAIRFQIHRRALLPERIVRVHALRGWWGTQAVILPRSLAENVARWESGHHGWDVHLKEYLVTQAVPLYAPIPNPVQHRRVPSVHNPGSRPSQSETFGRTSDGGGISPPIGIDWCPDRLWEPDPRAT